MSKRNASRNADEELEGQQEAVSPVRLQGASDTDTTSSTSTGEATCARLNGAARAMAVSPQGGACNLGNHVRTSPVPPGDDNMSAIKKRRLEQANFLVITGASLRQPPSNGTSCALSVKNFRVTGLCAAPVTPFKDNGDINPAMLDSYVQHLLDFGIKNIFANGTTGEGNSMTVSERKRMAEAWVKAGKGKLSAIIMHIGSGNLRDSQELARHAQETGCDAIACVSPTYHKPQNMECYVEYMRQVAAAAPQLPFFLYDFEGITGVSFNSNEFFHAAKDVIPTLRGIKHTTPNFTNMHSIIHDHGDRFQVLLGCDEIYMEGLMMGISVTVMMSFNGKVLNRVRAAFESGDTAATFKEQTGPILVGNLMRRQNQSFPGNIKSILRALGLDVGSPRLPLAPVTDKHVAAMKKELTAIGYFDWGAK